MLIYDFLVKLQTYFKSVANQTEFQFRFSFFMLQPHRGVETNVSALTTIEIGVHVVVVF